MNYSQPSDEQLLEAYKNAYPQIRVYPDKTEVEQRVSKLEEQIQERNGTIAALVSERQEKTSELHDLKAGLERVLNRLIELEKAKDKKAK